jgi:HSP20 family protein
MAGTEVTKGSGPGAGRQLDIFSAMRDEMDRVFERFESGWPSLFRRGFEDEMMVPALDVHDNGKQLSIEIDLPGVEEKDVTVTLANGILSVKGEKKSQREETKDNYYMAERSYGSFERTLRMPDSIDENKLEAKFDKGVLKITAPKRPEAVKAEKRIEIKKS